MPGTPRKKKELYLGKCLGDLHNFSEIKQLGNNATIIIKSSNKVFSEAETYDAQGDEEKAYVMYLKYFNILKQAKAKADYKKQKDYFDSLIGKKNQLKAIDRAEHLSESLKERYDLKEAEAVAKKLAVLDMKSTSAKSVDNEATSVQKVEIKAAEEKQGVENPSVPSGTIGCVSLCELLRDGNTKLIVMDVRPKADFNQSHICHTECISVPEEILTPGSTVNHIQAKLSEESKTIWLQRQNADHIIILDWKSTLETVSVGTPLRTLKDALFKFDLNTIIKSEPLVLEGGYEQWLLFYPTLTTNAHVTRPSDSSQLQPPSPTMTLDFDYPELDENLQAVTASVNPPVPEIAPAFSEDLKRPVKSPVGLPQVDRSLKPSVSGDRKSAVNAPIDPGKSVPFNNEKTSGAGESSQNGNYTTESSGLYPTVSTYSSSKNTNILNDRTTNGPKSISLSIRNNLESDLSQSVIRREEKEAELREFQRSQDSTMRENRHKLEEAEKKLRDLELMKKKEEKEVADLMRMKRKLREEIDEEKHRQEVERQHLAAEEGRRLALLEQARGEEEDKKQRLQEVERMRQERKKAEETKELARRQQQELEREERKLEKLRVAELREKELEAEKMEQEKKKESQRKLEEEKHKEESDLTLQRQEEEVKRIQKEQEAAWREEEKEQIERERKRREEVELERKRIEELEQKKREENGRKKREEMERKRQEEAGREKANQEREAAEQLRQRKAIEQASSKIVPSTMLPKGWEKRLDRATNRYFYIDHNREVTQWVPPSVPASLRTSDIYTMKLKDEPTILSSRGLSRSHSSPNIKKQLEEEEEEAARKIPSIDRGNKPPISPALPIPKQPAYVVRKRDLNPVYGNVGPALTGLRNLGNTCYMNSTIQCLNNASPLVSYFLNDSYLHDINRESSQGMHGEMVDEFAVVVKALWSQQYRSITPRDLKNTIAKYNPMFAGYQQQDSQEFLTFLLDGLHEGLNEVRTTTDIPEQNNDNVSDSEAAAIAWKHHKLLHKSIIIELFQGQLKSTVMCQTCGKKSVTFEAFMFLSLPIPASSKSSLKGCIQEFLKPETMTGSSKWKCPCCRVERISHKKIDIWKVPPILLVVLNRFYSEGMWMQKKTAYVDFPISDLDFSPYIIGPPPQNRYNLYGISNHYGTMEGGHYTAFCRNTVNKKWYKFDDQDVYEMSQSDVKTSAAFVLYYSSIELPAPKYRPHI